MVIGPSGSGKSTFLRCLNLLERPSSGSITFGGVDITDPRVNIDIHRQKMGMVFQHFNLFPHMTILENMTLAPIKLLRKSREEAESKARALLERVGLGDRADAYPSQLSAPADVGGHAVQGVDGAAAKVLLQVSDLDEDLVFTAHCFSASSPACPPAR